jgi:hypothetical protein
LVSGNASRLSRSAADRIERRGMPRPLNGVKSPVRLHENGTQQAREPRIQFGTAQRVLMDRAGDARMDETGLAQYPEVMGHAGFGAAAVKLPARRFCDARQGADDFQAHRVAQSVENSLQDEFLSGRMVI